MAFINGWRGPNIVDNGLILYLDAASPSSYRSDLGTTWRDISGNSNNGTLVNTPTFNSDGYFTFNGSNYVSAPLATNSITNVTLQCWVNISTTSKSGGFVTVGGGSNGYSIGVGQNTYDSPGNEIIGIFGLVRWIDTNTTYGVTGWKMVNLVLGPTSVPSIYVDGTLIGSYSGTNPITPTGNIFIGCEQAGGRPFSGDISTVQIYNRALSQSEITQNYNALRDSRYPLSIVTNGLTLHLDAGNTASYPGTGTTWTDISSYANTFTLSNTSFNSGNQGSIVFNGSNAGATGPNASVYSITYNITLEFWGYFTTTGNYYIMGKGPSNGVANFYPGNYEVQINNTNSLTFLAQSNNSDASYFTYSSATNVYSNNTWTHFAFVITNDGTQTISSMAFYVNGSVVGGTSSGTGKAVATNAEPLRIGLRKDGAAMPGRLAIVRTYNRGLSAAEIRNNYNAQKSRFGL